MRYVRYIRVPSERWLKTSDKSTIVDGGPMSFTIAIAEDQPEKPYAFAQGVKVVAEDKYIIDRWIDPLQFRKQEDGNYDYDVVGDLPLEIPYDQMEVISK